MTSLLSSPGKQAQQAASAEGAINSQDIGELESYTTGQEQQLRNAIGATGPNPYFAAAQQMSPSKMKVNPKDTTTFSNVGPGTTTSSNSGPVVAPLAPPGQQQQSAMPAVNPFAAPPSTTVPKP